MYHENRLQLYGDLALFAMNFEQLIQDFIQRNLHMLNYISPMLVNNWDMTSVINNAKIFVQCTELVLDIMFQKEDHQNVKCRLCILDGLWRNRTGASKFTCENDPDASGNASSNYENNEVNTYPLNSSELNAATERKLSLLSSYTSAETCDKRTK
ncbi:hypothetical protein TNCT_362481 [Trichonephila clavata]|uniref:Uncharacterized protein n=1 Tax=Trichonephila clavata TaxID=2740835 RepID=A0A8X6HUI6_TRICU|nr:hypothetical protein TNCT_362481 [Trichonephila clavata]